LFRIADITVRQHSFFIDFGDYFYIITGHHGNPSMALTEPLCSVEPQLV